MLLFFLFESLVLFNRLICNSPFRISVVCYILSSINPVTHQNNFILELPLFMSTYICHRPAAPPWGRVHPHDRRQRRSTVRSSPAADSLAWIQPPASDADREFFVSKSIEQKMSKRIIKDNQGLVCSHPLGMSSFSLARFISAGDNVRIPISRSESHVGLRIIVPLVALATSLAPPFFGSWAPSYRLVYATLVTTQEDYTT
jgi:hypothetical protein